MATPRRVTSAANMNRRIPQHLVLESGSSKNLVIHAFNNILRVTAALGAST
jgi:hypothetical protein